LRALTLRPAVAVAAVAVALAGLGPAAAGAPGETPCAATPLGGNGWVELKPLSSGIRAGWPAQTADRRALLYVGGRSPDGMNMKVLWIVRRHWGASLKLDGRRLDRPGAFTQRFPMALSPVGNFPSIVVVPRAGCWRLTARTGALVGRLVVRAVNP
jgi:hypothetical protein